MVITIILGVSFVLTLAFAIYWCKKHGEFLPFLNPALALVLFFMAIFKCY